MKGAGMMPAGMNLETTARLFKSRVNVYALWGVVIAVIAVIIATLLVSYLQYGGVTLNSIIRAQMHNPALWLLDTMPFLFALWGQYTGTMMAYRASAMVADETASLRTHTSALEYHIRRLSEERHLSELLDERTFRMEVENLLPFAEANLRPAGVMRLDFDQFHGMRDALDRVQIGALIKGVGARLQAVVRDHDLLAHFGQDEFAILLSKLRQGQDIRIVAERICESVKNPVMVGGTPIILRPRIGAAVFPRDGQAVDTLMRQAELGKQAARANDVEFVLKDADKTATVREQLELLAALHHAVRDRELDLVVRPQESLDGSRLAHVRCEPVWRSDSALIDEHQIRAMAVRGGFIDELVRWELNALFELMHRWRAGLIDDLRGVIRLPGSNLLSLDLPDMLAGLLAAHDLPASAITLEFTDSGLYASGSEIGAQLKAISRLGIPLALADFGGAHSPIDALLRNGFSEVRLTRDLVRQLDRDDRAGVLVGGLIDAVSKLGLDTVAPGVETRQQMIRLKEMGPTRVEGSFIQDALDPRAFAEWVRLQLADTAGGVTIEESADMPPSARD
jgi:diguanylate cyclase (GGDEF)-like protein